MTEIERAKAKQRWLEKLEGDGRVAWGLFYISPLCCSRKTPEVAHITCGNNDFSVRRG